MPAEAGRRAVRSGSELLQAFDHPAIVVRAVAGQTAPGGARIRSWRSCSTRSPPLTHGRSRNGCASPISLWVFVVMGIAGSVGGIVRGHLVFTDVMNRPHIESELRRTAAGEAVRRRADGAAC